MRSVWGIRKKPKIFYGWIITAACFITSSSIAFFYAYTVFFKPLQAEFGWDRTSVSSVYSIWMFTFSFSTYFMGKLTDKYGPRLTLISGAFLMGIGLSLCSQVSAIWHLYLLYFIAAIGSGVVWSLPTATVQRWFLSKRGLALGIASSGIGFGILVILPLANFLVFAFGWRIAYIIMGASAWFILSVMGVVMAYSPEKKGLRAYGAVEVDTPLDLSSGLRSSETQKERGWSLKEAVKSKTFVLICILYGLLNIPFQMVIVHIVPFATDIGITQSTAATALGALGGISVVSRIISGYIGERCGWKNSLFFFNCIAAVALFCLTRVSSLWEFLVFVIIFGIVYGAQFVLIVGLIGFYFGTKSLGELIGFGHGICILSGAFAPVLAGFIFDTLHSYFMAFSIGAVAYAIAAILTYIMKRPRVVPLGHAGKGASPQ